ncbi:replicative DNA helicase [Minwuia thermotolerans]|uniref:Replicative DNA helicase n=1 Tax=Minwuia thermotolerans TaxID=2056226 RepID=A0A2M9G1N6_9PROT|nr:replicative DNA helicase [Minwuia thermotolerans]PJK29630.1 replicative DNA helicase [Minwuia thermotolerans]
MSDNITAFPGDAPDHEGGDAAPKVLPHNLEAEQQLLGALLYNNDAAARVLDFLKPEHFFQPLHGRIYESILTLIERGELANPVTLKTRFEQDAAIRELGGPGYLVDLTARAVNVIRAEEYARILYDLFLRREIILLSEEMAERGRTADLTDAASQQIEDAESRLYTLAEAGEVKNDFRSFKIAVAESLDRIEAAYKREGQLVGVTTGLREMDQRLGGLHRTDLLILAGRPGMGKSALAMTIALNATRAYRPIYNDAGDIVDAEGAVVGVFSLEMSREQLATRIVSEQTRISSSDLRTGRIDKNAYLNTVVPATQELMDLPLFIDDTPALSIAQLRSRARRLKRQHGLGLIIIDYIQLMRPSGQKRVENRVQELTEITQGLKAVAKELNVPVLALSQLSRQVEQREDKRPQLSDLRESGSIEQDADVVMFVYREAYYAQKDKPDEENFAEMEQWQQKMAQIYNRAEIIIGKQRHGPTGTMEVFFEPEFTIFRNLDTHHDPSEIH